MAAAALAVTIVYGVLNLAALCCTDRYFHPQVSDFLYYKLENHKQLSVLWPTIYGRLVLSGRAHFGIGRA